MQTRKQSATEVIAGTVIAFLISVFVGEYIIFPAYHMQPSMAANLWVTLWFTLVSIVRSYVVRRLFNWVNDRSLK